MRRRQFVAAALATSLAPTPFAPRARAATGPAVLELFTSQGCSSCPPADALLGQLAHEPGIIALAWHVDYWNGLGWHDPYSSALATERQQRYAARLNEEVYTPALVVNGARIVVGSDKPAVREAIGTAGGLSVPVTLHRDGAATIAEIGAAGAPVSALLATYDPAHATQIGAGENGGRKLVEYRIVREATPLGTWSGDAWRITLPAIAPDRGAVLLVQGADLRIIGATDLPSRIADDKTI
jgi:hypothetical protein